MIVLDIETTGTNEKTDCIVEISALDFYSVFDNPDMQVTPKELFYLECRAEEGATYTEEALARNGYTLEQITDEKRPQIQEALDKLKEWLGSLPKKRTLSDGTTVTKEFILTGQNPHFDWMFLREKYQVYRSIEEFLEDWGYRIFDQHSIVVDRLKSLNIPVPLNKHGKSNLNSEAVMAFVGIPPEPNNHIASNGVIWEAEAMSRLLHYKNLFDQFKCYNIPAYLSSDFFKSTRDLIDVEKANLIKKLEKFYISNKNDLSKLVF